MSQRVGSARWCLPNAKCVPRPGAALSERSFYTRWSPWWPQRSNWSKSRWLRKILNEIKIYSLQKLQILWQKQKGEEKTHPFVLIINLIYQWWSLIITLHGNVLFAVLALFPPKLLWLDKNCCLEWKGAIWWRFILCHICISAMCRCVCSTAELWVQAMIHK